MLGSARQLRLRPAAVAFALGEAVELQVMAGFGQTGHRADKAEWPSLTPSGGWAGRNLAPQRGADLILTARYAAPDLVGPADAI